MNPTLALFSSLIVLAAQLHAADLAGASGKIGAPPGAKIVHRLEVTKPGVYENFILDGQWAAGNLVKITADDVTIRNCEIHSGKGNAIGVFGRRIVIENCLIHHMLNGSFADQQDAHGISGFWGAVTIRKCEIHHCSGDSVQFDPDRRSNGQLTIEHCTFWTGPLTEHMAGFHRGETPGENAFDSKTKPDGERCKIIIRHSYFHGWQQPGQIDNMAALNLKENIAATISNCVFQNHEIALRVRGPGKHGGAQVEVRDCAFYDCAAAVRVEDKAVNLKLTGLAFDAGVKEKLQNGGGGNAGPGFVNDGGHKAAPISELIVKPQP